MVADDLQTPQPDGRRSLARAIPLKVRAKTTNFRIDRGNPLGGGFFERHRRQTVNLSQSGAGDAANASFTGARFIFIDALELFQVLLR